MRHWIGCDIASVNIGILWSISHPIQCLISQQLYDITRTQGQQMLYYVLNYCFDKSLRNFHLFCFLKGLKDTSIFKKNEPDTPKITKGLVQLIKIEESTIVSTSHHLCCESKQHVVEKYNLAYRGAMTSESNL